MSSGSQELRELQVEKKDLQELHLPLVRQCFPEDKLALNVKDLELLEEDLGAACTNGLWGHRPCAWSLGQENERLRQHVKSFQRDVNEILA